MGETFVDWNIVFFFNGLFYSISEFGHWKSILIRRCVKNLHRNGFIAGGHAELWTLLRYDRRGYRFIFNIWVRFWYQTDKNGALKMWMKKKNDTTKSKYYVAWFLCAVQITTCRRSRMTLYKVTLFVWFHWGFVISIVINPTERV